MAINAELLLDGEDVVVKPIEPEMCECGEDVETHEVMVDFRTAGQANSVFRGCKACAENIASRIREGIGR